eukprot:7398875-Pyramimonas_sp.AAC.1
MRASRLALRRSPVGPRRPLLNPLSGRHLSRAGAAAKGGAQRGADRSGGARAGRGARRRGPAGYLAEVRAGVAQVGRRQDRHARDVRAGRQEAAGTGETLKPKPVETRVTWPDLGGGGLRATPSLAA